MTLALAEPDDFTLIIPKFSTNFNFEIYGQGVLRNGNFENSLIEKNNLVKDYFKKSVYSTYLNLGRPVFRIKNICSSKESPKIFVIMDSYLKVVIPFLACVSREIIAVDPGKRNGEIHFDGSIKKFILKEKPDFVLLSYNVATFDKDSKVIDNFTTFH
ncbi:MAG: hypothetical protein J6Z11_13805 [Candidatus Riflebacteria bacterium]|nr:hypothetical protein [Candidatus Riflebacteria bacterium]